LPDWIINDRGLVGKCLDWGDSVTVLVESSPLDQVRRRFDPAECKRGNIPYGTRIYYKRGASWFKGFYESLTTPVLSLVFDDWQQGMQQVPLDQVHPFSTLSPASPLRFLAAGVLDSPDFLKKRQRFLLKYQNVAWACGPFPALAQAKIDIHAHQIENVLKVLGDQKLRYLLADEVGLGKTIEAGLIAKQLVIDGLTDIIVLVPEALREQWKSELRLRFGLGSPTVSCLSFDEIKETEINSCTFLIVDEAHQVVASRHGRDGWLYDIVEQLARSTDKLLLISATPSTNNDEDFLAMLHLLDPENYDLNKLPEFKAQVSKRREIGELVSALRDRPIGIELRNQMDTVMSLFPEDWQLVEMARTLKEESRDPSRSNECLQRTITMSVEIADRYGVDRRVLRASRVQIANALLNGRQSLETKVVPEFIDDELLLPICDALENWRVSALGWGYESEALAKIYVLFESASSCWPGYLMALVEARRGADRQDQVFEADLRLLCDTPTFPGEDQYLLSLIESCRIRLEQPGDALETCAKALISKLETMHECAIVVFASESFVLREFERRLKAMNLDVPVFWRDLGQSIEEGARAVTDFIYLGGKRILLCDRSGQEGLNLERADVAFMLDLPFQPVLIEQRLGRLDRIGRKRPFQVRVLVGAEGCGLQSSWFELLSYGFGIFNDSIAPLQFFLERTVPLIRQVAFKGGGRALGDEVERLRTEVELQRRIIRNDRMLSEVDVEPRIVEICKSLADCQKDFSSLQKAFEEWAELAWRLTNRKQLERLANYRIGSDTLLSTNGLKQFRQYCRKTPLGLEFSGTFNRGYAARFPGTDFITFGHPILDLLFEQAITTDLGTCCIYRRMTSTIPVGRATVCFKLYVTVCPRTEDVSDFWVRRTINFACRPLSMKLVLKQNGQLLTDDARKREVMRDYDANRDHAFRPESLANLYKFMSEDEIQGVCNTIGSNLKGTLLGMHEVQTQLKRWNESFSLRFNRMSCSADRAHDSVQILENLGRPSVKITALEMVFLEGSGT
jgi:ATP-dependent helicase HepA